MKTINYHTKKFKVVSNSESGALSSGFVFEYEQHQNTLRCTYHGEHIVAGNLLGTVSKKGVITMVYQQLDKQGVLRTGRCTSTPKVMPNGKIRLHEFWEWTSGERTKGNSILEEI